MAIKITKEVELYIPEGWEFVRFGSPQKGEYSLRAIETQYKDVSSTDIARANDDTRDYFFVIVKPARWRAEPGEKYYHVTMTNLRTGVTEARERGMIMNALIHSSGN